VELDVLVDDTAPLLPALAALPVCASVLVEEHWGERDVRVAVAPASGGEPVVELLCPAPVELGPGDRAGSWHAVVVRTGRRRLWRGPDAGCPTEQVAGFVRDLLDLPPAVLRTRWSAIG
jgi:hypothetical protein